MRHMTHRLLLRLDKQLWLGLEGRAVVEVVLAVRLDQGRHHRPGFVKRVSLLIVDGVGYLPVELGGANLFFQPVNARHEKGATVLTSVRGLGYHLR